LDPALDYSKLDDSGLIRVGEYVTETTVIVGRYMQVQGGKIKDASFGRFNLDNKNLKASRNFTPRNSIEFINPI
jgi:DNA-directed RNA polymerase beta subunit